MLPCIRHEDEHLLVVDKPSGWNTHTASKTGGEGIYDWLRDREPRWAHLALVHRLDKDTSGLLVFGKTREANRSLSSQFEGREVRKVYRFLTDRVVKFDRRTVAGAIVRVGDRYMARPMHAGATEAVTHFERLGPLGDWTEWEARPVTGLTHQVRVHAAAAGLPVVGDSLYGGAIQPVSRPFRLCLHAYRLRLRHPVFGRELTFESPPAFLQHGPWSLREALVDPELTDAYRLAHGAGDGVPGRILERWGEWLLWQSDIEDEGDAFCGSELEAVVQVAKRVGCRGVYGQRLHRRLQGKSAGELAPRLVWGEEAPASWFVHENGVRYEVRFGEGYSVGLFLDQRDNRRRVLVNHVARDFPVKEGGLGDAEILNLFAYTCGFSVSGALSGARTTNVDLSRRVLEWGKSNFRANRLAVDSHEFLAGDAFEWSRRLTRAGRRFDLVVLDPPTFSRTRKGRIFRIEQDLVALVQAAVPLVKSGGVLFVSTNAVGMRHEEFGAQIESTIGRLGRVVQQEHAVSQPPDFPSTREQPAHLKTVWMQLED
jgi:23S rRNA (cytosine1962-C5)-methyltransferase